MPTQAWAWHPTEYNSCDRAGLEVKEFCECDDR
jgi:hypothetical protein